MFGLVPGAGVRVADQEAVAHVLGVREVAVDRRDDRDALGLRLRVAQRLPVAAVV